MARYSNMTEYLRSTGNLYVRNSSNTINISSLNNPALNLYDNTLYLPGSDIDKDNSPIYFVLDKVLTRHDYELFSAGIKIIIDKIIYTINRYNDLLSNEDLNKEEGILIKYIPPIEIIEFEQKFISKYYPNEITKSSFYALNNNIINLSKVNL